MAEIRSLPDANAQLSLSGINVEFGATRALIDVSLAIEAGQIVGLVGHNGAGKSTLFNVISGALTARSGTVSVGGIYAHARPSPRAMAKMGIVVIHQEPALAHNLSVVDNIFLGQETLVARGERTLKARLALERVGAELDLTRHVSTLTLGERQLVDLARGLVRGNIQVLMLDEPTAALGKTETDILHGLIQKLAAEGVSVIYVSHRLPDILSVCDRVVILRAGKIQEDGPAAQYDGRSLARALAPDMGSLVAAREPHSDTELLACYGEFSEVKACKGEVVGLFGMAGGRQFKILENMFGLHGQYRFSFGSNEIAVAAPRQAIENGIYLVPADRENDGVVSGQSALDTVFLPWFKQIRGNGLWIGPKTGHEVYQEARRALRIVGPAGDAPIDGFSGGNRQKHLVARWALITRPKLLLLSQPTQGVDIGARTDIANAIHAIADEGVTVLVSSSESDEIALLCDRAYVMTDRQTASVSRSEYFGEELLQTLLALATNAGEDFPV